MESMSTRVSVCYLLLSAVWEVWFVAVISTAKALEWGLSFRELSYPFVAFAEMFTHKYIEAYKKNKKKNMFFICWVFWLLTWFDYLITSNYLHLTWVMLSELCVTSSLGIIHEGFQSDYI